MDLQESTTDGSNLDHGRDIALDVGLLNGTVRVVVDVALKVLGIEGAGDQTLVNSAGSTHQPKGDHGKPELPVEDLAGLAEVLQAEDVDRLLRTACHGEIAERRG